MAHVKRDKAGLNPRLDMTPMIDVVFQLLIFFVVAVKQEDILSTLTAARPSLPPVNHETPIDLIDVGVSSQGFTFNGRPVSKTELDNALKRYSRVSRSAMVTIRCSADSPHAFLVQSLDICSKHGMVNISIFSM